MKKIVMIFSLAVLLSSCYKDYVSDNAKSFVYLPNSTNVRTFVVGEGMKVEVGAVLAGVLHNGKDRVVNYKINNDLVTPQVFALMQQDARDHVKLNLGTTLAALSSDSYTLSDPSKMVIKSGLQNGTVTVRPDSVKFLSNVGNLKAQFALGFEITTCADVDTINQALKTAVIAFRYENMLFGNWYRGGMADNNGTKSYYTAKINQSNDDIGVLSTLMPMQLYYNRYGVPANKGGMVLTLNADKTISISNAVGSTISVVTDGECKYNNAKKLQDRKIFLSYKYTEAGVTVSCKDTLSFRDRVRDGVLEYQDENPNNYK